MISINKKLLAFCLIFILLISSTTYAFLSNDFNIKNFLSNLFNKDNLIMENIKGSSNQKLSEFTETYDTPLGEAIKYIKKYENKEYIDKIEFRLTKEYLDNIPIYVPLLPYYQCIDLENKNYLTNQHFHIIQNISNLVSLAMMQVYPEFSNFYAPGGAYTMHPDGMGGILVMVAPDNCEFSAFGYNTGILLDRFCLNETYIWEAIVDCKSILPFGSSFYSKYGCIPTEGWGIGAGSGYCAYPPLNGTQVWPVNGTWY